LSSGAWRSSIGPWAFVQDNRVVWPFGYIKWQAEFAGTGHAWQNKVLPGRSAIKSTENFDPN
jgi:hypothetical protein